MSQMTLLAFLLLTTSFLNLWVRKDPKIWGALLGLSLLCSFVAGNVTWVGLLSVATLALLWFIYIQRPNVALFILLISASALFKLHLLPGFIPFFFTSKFAIGLEGALIGLFPLALIVPLAKNLKEWRGVLIGLLWGCAGIAIIALLATLSGATRWQLKLPSFIAARMLSNLFLTSLPEEGFFRGFIQKTLSRYFNDLKLGKIMALVLTTFLFTVAHLYWSPNLQILAFVFLAGLLYGGVYLISGKIESAILTHFLLNVIHMVFFSYHA